MNRVIRWCTVGVMGITILTGCSEKVLLKEALDVTMIDKIQVVEAMGNPTYGAASKVITDPKEIQELVSIFNSGRVGKKIKDEELGVADKSSYYFFDGDDIIQQILCNGNDSNSIWTGDGYYHIDYKGQERTPFEIYEASDADTVTVDKQLKEMIMPSKAKWALGDTLGVTMPELDYASEDKVIFHGYFGLFIYDLQREEIVQSLDLESIGCQWAQGSNYCEIEVSEDGNVITLHPMESEEMYRYTVDTQILEKVSHIPMEKPFQVVLNENPNGAVSFEVVTFEEGEVGYLEAQSDTLEGLYYRRGEKQYKLFKE